MRPHTPLSPPAIEDPRARDERRLAEGLIRGSHEEVAEFLERSHRAVFGLAGRLTRDPDQRRDWTHAVLLGLLEDLEGGRFVYRRPGSFWAWFRKRAYFRLIDEYRRDRKRALREGSVADESQLHEDLETFGVADASEELERLETRKALEACLAALENSDHRRALELLLLEELSYEEIAGGMAAPLNTVRAWIRRGRLAVRRCLTQRLGLEAGS